MKKAHKLLILLLILATSIGLGITYSEARVCFVVGGCDGDDGTKKSRPKVMDCKGLGFKYLADGKANGMDKTEVGRAAHVGKGEPCTSGNQTYYKHKVCKAKYIYVNVAAAQTALDIMESRKAAGAKMSAALAMNKTKTAEFNRPSDKFGLEKQRQAADILNGKKGIGARKSAGGSNVNGANVNGADVVLALIKGALDTGYHMSNVRTCNENATLGGDSCVDAYGLKGDNFKSITKYTQCLCDAKYKYFAEEVRKGFKIDYEKSTSCATSGVDGNDGKLRYDVARCSGDYEAGGYWKETCGTQEYAFRTDTWGDLTCNLCMPNQKPCPGPDCPIPPTSPCSGHNLYATPNECYAGNGVRDARSFTCKIIIVGNATCYERAYKSCAELAAAEAAEGYYGYYGYYNAGYTPFIQYFDTKAECMNGMSSNEVCSSRTLWSDTYYGSNDGKECYFREFRKATRTCADFGKFDSIGACTDTKKNIHRVKVDREKLLDRLRKEDLVKPYDKSELFNKLGKTELFIRLDRDTLLNRLNKDDILKPFDKVELIGKLGKDTLVTRLDTATLATRIDKADLAKAFTTDQLIAPFAKDELVARFGTTELTTRAATNVPAVRRAAAMRDVNTAALSTTERTAMIADLNKSELFASYSAAEVVDRLDKNVLIDRLGIDAVTTRVGADQVLNRFDKAELVQSFDKVELFNKIGKDTLVRRLEKDDLLTRLGKEDMIMTFERGDLINRLNKEDLLNRLENAGLIKVTEEEVVTEESHSCRLVMTEGLTCYERVEIDCATFSGFTGPESYYRPYYYAPMHNTYVRYFNSFTECMATNNTGAKCVSKLMAGKNCYYREEPAESKTLMDRVSGIFSGIADKFAKAFDKTEVKQTAIDGAAMATTRVDGIADAQHFTNTATKVFDAGAAKVMEDVAVKRVDEVPTKRVDSISSQFVGSEMAASKAMVK